jgi:hypothetical protein
MKPGDIVKVNFPGNGLHGKKVTICRIEAMDIAHPNCPEPMVVEMIFVTHPTLPEPVGIGREKLR